MNKKILLVDDEPDILELIGYNLRQEGYDVFTAENGKQGIDMARSVNPDLIILDVMMPEMDGMEVATSSARTPSSPTPPSPSSQPAARITAR